MRIAATLASFTLGQSDVLRKAMGKKNPAVMQAQREKFVTGAVEERHQREEGDAHLRPDGALRRVRLQQVALDDLRVPRVSDGLSEGELPVAFPGRAADDRSAEHRQAGAVPRRVPRSRHPGAAAGHQRERAALHGDAAGRALRPDGDQERRRGRDRVDPGGPAGTRADPLASGSLRRARPAPGQQARAREPGEGRRAGLARAAASRRRARRCRRACCGRG